MTTLHPAARPAAARTALRDPGYIPHRTAVLLLAVLPALGCAQLGYDRLQIGQTQRDYQNALPEDGTRRTTLGVCRLEQDLFGGTDAMLVLLTTDRRIAAKLHAIHVERHVLGAGELTYQLHAELDPNLLRLSRTGTADLLRVLADELTSVEGDAAIRAAHGWAAAGLMRMFQQWPHAGDEGPALPRLTDMLERVPRGGTARITVQPGGIHVLEYAVRVALP